MGAFGPKRETTGENYIMRSFRICTVCRYCEEDQFMDYGMERSI
jgi:hypothetical protein